MAFDQTLAALMRQDLDGLTAVEKKMFGGIAFMVGGHMVCGLYKGGGIFRVGAPGMAEALAVPGVRTMDMAGKPMQGMVETAPEVVADAAARGRLMALALGFVKGLPPKR